jgi:hypothetical protein
MHKAQNAIEYLSTYAWAIMLLMVVLVVLFFLGIFNPSTYSQSANPGGCQVYKPYGPNTQQFVGLEGTCNSAKPRTVAYFNGQTSYVSVGTSLLTGNQITFALWAEKLGSGNQGSSQVVFSQTGIDYMGSCVSAPIIQINSHSAGAGACAQTGVWNQYVGTYNGVTLTMYVNGTQVGTASGTGNIGSGTDNIGQYTSSFNFNGYIADVQIYNTSLSANSVKVLYKEGIGGDPVNIKNLVGWWPLNGDVKDYSGNGNNGMPNFLTFISTWSGGYSTP